VSEVLEGCRDFMAWRHRPAHGRRTAERWAAHLVPHLRPEMQVSDVGCGPGSITTGLVGRVVGVDLVPVPIEAIPWWACEPGQGTTGGDVGEGHPADRQ
jgi:hypothetical protein